MTSLTFFAAWDDFHAILDYVFAQTDCRVYEGYSLFDRDLREFASVAAVQAALSLSDTAHNKPPLFLQGWSPATGGKVDIRRITLKPRAVNGHTHRFAIEGWGLLQFQFGGMQNGQLKASRIAHNSEARALAWESNYADTFGPVSAWNWSELAKLSGKLQYHIRRRLSVDKLGSRIILGVAADLRNAGVVLREI